MEERGYHKCTACQKPWLTEEAIRQRKPFSGPVAEGGTLDWELEDWDCVLWSGECTFQLGRHSKKKVIRQRDERYCLDCIQFRNKRGGECVSIWGGIGRGYKTKLIFLEGSGKRNAFTQSDYED